MTTTTMTTTTTITNNNTTTFSIIPGTKLIKNPDPKKKDPIEIHHDFLEVQTIAAIIRNFIFVQTKGDGTVICHDETIDGPAIHLHITNATNTLLNQVIQMMAQRHFIYQLVTPKKTRKGLF